MKVDTYAPGMPCTVNLNGDIAILAEAREFFGVPCVVIKRTKAGLILVARQGDLTHAYPFPQRNVDVHNACAAGTPPLGKQSADCVNPPKTAGK